MRDRKESSFSNESPEKENLAKQLLELNYIE